MSRIIIFIVGAFSAVTSEVFWKGESRRSVALWGGAGMLLLRRIVLRFPFESRALLCVVGALLLIVLRIIFLLLRRLLEGNMDAARRFAADMPTFSYGLYRFMLIAPAYTIIEYLEARFGM